jgi:hypothetical protein
MFVGSSIEKDIENASFKRQLSILQPNYAKICCIFWKFDDIVSAQGLTFCQLYVCHSREWAWMDTSRAKSVLKCIECQKLC